MSHPLVVFSHLRWNFVYQRPQHLMTSLAKQRRVHFFEEPVHTTGTERLEVTEVAPDVTVLRPHTNDPSPGFSGSQMPALRSLLARYCSENSLTDCVAWLYSPMAVPLLHGLPARLVVYDCMDELTGFLGAPQELAALETELLRTAQLVFTGGTSLYDAKKRLHPAVHCFPSSVDAAHFAAPSGGTDTAALQRGVPRPRLGYFGVIDERLDLALIGALAGRRPDWHVVMVGPVAKIDPCTLPRLPNIHYLGQRPYSELPALVHGWDLCLLPFARNSATRFISPTKTLEYMAAGKPIVSTPVADVSRNHGDLVAIAEGVDEFMAACQTLLGESPVQRALREAAMAVRISKTSWDATAAQMEQLVDAALSRDGAHPRVNGEATDAAVLHPVRTNGSRNGDHAAMPMPSRAGGLAAGAIHDRLHGANGTHGSNGANGANGANGTPRANGTKGTQGANGAHAAPARVRVVPGGDTFHDAVIIGAGPTGLSAAYHFGASSLLLEQNDTVGGWCRSIQDRGFTFDYAGHIMFSNDPYVHELYAKLLGDNVHWQDREAWIYSKSVYTRYPFQGALHGLPPDVLKECLIGAIEARFGSIAPSAATAARSHGQNGSASSSDGTAAPPKAPSAATASQQHDSAPPANFEEFIYKVWGKGVAKHFAIPYNKKLWTVPLTEMETSWLGGRVPLPDLEEMIDGALRPPPKKSGPNARFGYPLRGGFQAMMDAFVPLLDGDLRTGARVVRVDAARHEVRLADGTRHRYRQLISTAPLPKFIAMLADEVPDAVREAAGKLRHVSVRCVNLGVARERITDKHWIYYPEDTVFHRIFVQGNASPHCNAPGGFGLTCEITYSPAKPLPADGEALIDLCIADCVRSKLLREDDVVVARNQLDLPYAYVVYDHARKAAVELIQAWLRDRDILLSGRYSEWQYYNSDHAFLAGRKIAEAAKRRIAAATATAGAAASATGTAVGE